MELVVPMARSPDFVFDSAAVSPYATAPSSPRPFGEPFNYHYHYTSAPTSPTRAAALYAQFSAWEAHALASPRSGSGGEMFEFAFDSGKQQGFGAPPPPEISTADELFEKGRIRPLQPPPPPAAAPGERGREKNSWSASSGNRARVSRSLSPLRNHHGFFTKNTNTAAATATATPAAAASTGGGPATSIVKGGGSKKWRLKDLLLFRSASEGRATERGSRDPLRKYSLLPSFSSLSSQSPSSRKKKGGEDSRNGSFRSTDSGGGSLRRRGGGVPAASAHEMHYTANRAVAEEQRKKTPLAYHRHGIFSCLQFNPAIRSITKGFSGNSFSERRS